jgi:hypothetical protein
LQTSGDFGFADLSPMQFPNLSRLEPRRHWPTQSFAILPSLGQASPSSFPQNLPFKLGEYSEKASHRTSGRCGQIQRLGQ